MATFNILNMEMSESATGDYSDDEGEFGDPTEKVGLGPSSSFSLISPRARNNKQMLFSPSPRSLKSPKGGSKGPKKAFDFGISTFPDLSEEGNTTSKEKTSSKEATSKSKDDQEIRVYGASAEGKEEEEEEVELTFDMIKSDVHTFVNNRMSKGERLHCVVYRRKGGITGYTSYEMHIDPIQDLNEDGEMLLLVGKRQSGNRTSNYHIHTGRRVSDRNYVGKVRSNFMGTEFVIYDDGVSHKNASKAKRTQKPIRLELGAVMYEKNLSKTNPRVMSVVMPNKPDTSGKGGTVQILNRMKSKDMEDIFYLTQKMPVWSEENQSYMLDFYGRVTQASVKNFMLLNPVAAHDYKQMTKAEKAKTELSGEHDMEDIAANALLFGRSDQDDVFVLDLGWPLSPLQAFSIVLTAFDSKLGCE